MGGDAEIRRALEYEKVRRLLRNERDRLDGGRACADDTDPLAAEIDPLMRPAAGLVPFALERIEAREGRRLRRREAARRHDAEPRRQCVVAIRPNIPTARRFVEYGFRHAGEELDVPPQIETIGDMVDVPQDFRLRCVALRPVPLLLKLIRKRVGIVHALDVAAGAGIAIPIPGAADPLPCLKYAGGEAEATQPVQHVKPGKPGSDDNRVDLALDARHR